MDTDLLTHIRNMLVQQALFRSTARLVVAVSGGPDSLGLLHALVQLRAQGGPSLHVAHLDHGFRGAASAADAAFVAAQAASWQVPSSIEQHDVPALAERWHLSAQAAARKARYLFLAQVADTVGAQALVTAHQADDQAETVLLHALRGAGPAGLRGMRPVVPWAEWADPTLALTPHPAPFLFRPLLAVPRATLVAYCAAVGLLPRDDPSNRTADYTRTRVRTAVLPALRGLNPNAVAALGRTAAICADDYAFMQHQVDALWPTLIQSEPGCIRVDGARWGGVHVALQRYVLRRAVALLGQAELSYAQIESARACAGAGVGHSLALGQALVLETTYSGFMIHSQDWQAEPEEPQLAQAYLELAAPRTALGNGWYCLVQSTAPPAPSPWWVGLAVNPASQLALRRRQAGDQILPAGGPGRRKLQDLFVDRKIPRDLRAAWPILLVDDEIAWVAGVRVAAQFSVPVDQAIIWVGLVQLL